MKIILVFDIDGVVRDVAGSYRRALADTVEHFTHKAYRPTPEDIDRLKSEGIWNNDWEGSQELVYRYFESQRQSRDSIALDYNQLVAFFQSRYRGTHPENWDGYITTEPLLLQPSYLEQLTTDNIAWGFFSGATKGSAKYVLEKRLGLKNPVLVAMEDAPGKPNPTGLFATVNQLDGDNENTPVIYVGDTVADMYTIAKAKEEQPQRLWIGVGVLPPHVQSNSSQSKAYAAKLKEAGAVEVLANVEQLNRAKVEEIMLKIS